ncbi:MAG: class I SAM-dependent methyltransferase [Bacteroidia bacterium]|nr:class I SAM-dependent methyltransferase [Bacteroidia bacterium]
MSFTFHTNFELYYNHQRTNTQQYVIPFIEQTGAIKQGMRVLEIGCAEGGVIRAFVDLGCTGTGIELVTERAERAKQFNQEIITAGKLNILTQNIYDVNPQQDFPDGFDLIVLKDVIEHIPDQQRFMQVLKGFLRPKGRIFLGFPPWYMPFGGHQQICHHKLLSKMPWIHLFPQFLYKKILKIAGESQEGIQELLEIQETGISIERFEKICDQENYHILSRKLFFINPIYALKFNLSPKELPSFFSKIPFFRNFVTTTAYFVVSP